MSTSTLESTRLAIAKKVRLLRRERRLSQAELAKKLGLSQSRLSELENGAGSFTAEQLVMLLQLFNVTLADFAPRRHRCRTDTLQNALARLGAVHLQERADVLPSEQLTEVADVVRETLIGAESARLLTALAPVLVLNINHLNLQKLHAQLVEMGLQRRLGWLLDNTRLALLTESSELSRPWALRYRRAALLIENWLAAFRVQSKEQRTAGTLPLDILDSDIRSRNTLDEVMATASDISHRWRIATSVQPSDFASALRAARADT